MNGYQESKVPAVDYWNRMQYCGEGTKNIRWTREEREREREAEEVRNVSEAEAYPMKVGDGPYG